MSTVKKSAEQLKIEFNSQAMLAEEVYTKARENVGYALQKSMAIKGALDGFELKLALAVSELEAELSTIDSNFKDKIG